MKKLSLIGLVVLIMGILFPLTACSAFACYTPQSAKAEQTRVVPVINALAAYQLDHGKFPADLKDLVPDYLSSVPQTSIGTNLGYGQMPNRSSYELCFRSQGWACSCTGCCYLQRSSGWECCTHGD